MMGMTVSIGLVAIGFAAFAMAARAPPIFPAHEARGASQGRGH